MVNPFNGENGKFNGENGKQQRFCREGNPYFEDFEITVKTLFESQKEKNPFIDSTMDLMKAIQSHLEKCQSVLAKTEALVVTARQDHSPPEEIEKLVSLCRAQQEIQVILVTEVIECLNKVVDNVFPR